MNLGLLEGRFRLGRDKLDGETVWLTILQMAQLFDRERSVIAKHLKAAITEGELDAAINVQNLHKNQKGRPQALYDFDAIMSVGYRVKSILDAHAIAGLKERI